MIVKLRYPPDYDGELHISVVPIATGNHYDISFTIGKAHPDETPKQALVRAARDIMAKVKP